MSTHFKPYELEGAYGLYYRFDKEGDGIAMHAHVQPELWHDTCCIKGSVEIYGDGVDEILEAGQRAKYKSQRAHEIRALEGGTEIFNGFLDGKPAGYEGLAEQQLTGEVDAVLQGRYETDL